MVGWNRHVTRIRELCMDMEYCLRNLFALLERRGKFLLAKGYPQVIANSVWACAQLGIKSSDLFRFLDEHVKCFNENATSQEIVHAASVCGQLGIKTPILFGWLDVHEHAE